MPNLFNSYCYSTIQEAADAEISLPAISVDVGVASSVSYTVINSTDVNLTYRYKPFSADLSTTHVLQKTYPSCGYVGYQHNFTGLSLSDVFELSWAVIFVWIIAYSSKLLRRAL